MGGQPVPAPPVRPDGAQPEYPRWSWTLWVEPKVSKVVVRALSYLLSFSCALLSVDKDIANAHSTTLPKLTVHSLNDSVR